MEERANKESGSIQKDMIDVLKKGGVKKVQYFKGLFSSTKRKGKKDQTATNIEDQFMKSGSGNFVQCSTSGGALQVQCEMY